VTHFSLGFVSIVCLVEGFLVVYEILWMPVRPQLAMSNKCQLVLSYFRNESWHLSVSVNAFLSQPFSAAQHGSSKVYN
jgi:hypothetical protein